LPARCRFCATPLEHTFVDLGTSPLCQKHVTPEDLPRGEIFYPLHVWVCHTCFLVQLEEFVAPQEIFGDGAYAYFSSFSDSWLAHARSYAEKMVGLLDLDDKKRVVELASNDGYLLQNFQERGIPCLGIEPAANCAQAAIERGIDTLVAFFGRETARQVTADFGPADLLLGNNVLAHVPDINDFVGGMKLLLAPSGVITMEFPHLMQLVDQNQFDTIYHEHFSYLSFGTVERIFAHHGLRLFDVEELDTHGGSLRIYACHAEGPERAASERVTELRERERMLGMQGLAYYEGFSAQVHATKRRLLSFLIEARDAGKVVAGYGAPGKGNTLLNYCGIRTDLLEYTVDRSPHKQGNFLPGTRVPIHAPEKIFETKPDYVLILPWNLKDEIMRDMAAIQAWDGRFVTPIPEVRVWSGPGEAA
jgi:hypothetical protein